MSNAGLTARRLLKHQGVGVLSTHSMDVVGYPFGSIAPYTLNHDGEPIILISEIAQHTRNIKHNNKVSLTVFDSKADDPQSGSRLTWIGDAQPVDASDIKTRDRYLRYFPSAESYFQAHDFSFYRIGLQRARFIGGFGEIYWIDSEAMLIKNPFSETEKGIVDHMNLDHQQALFHYCKSFGRAGVESVTMTGIDSEGFDLRADNRKLRIEFEAAIHTSEEARAALVELARR